MNLRNRLLSGATLLSAILAIPALTPMTAHAAAPDADAVVFSATAIVDGGVGGVAPIPATNTSGTYTFSSNNPDQFGPGVCLGFSVDSPPTPPSVEVSGGVNTPCDIESKTGKYNNTICGTGNASDTATIAEADADTYSVAYKIDFFAGVGVIEPTTATDASDGDSGPATGVVVITPTQGDCVTAGVTHFRATGVAVTTA